MNNITENIMANAIKSLFSFGKKIGECIAIDPDIYFEYIANVKADIVPFLPYNYLCIGHKHKDQYVLCADADVIDEIIKTGYIPSSVNADATDITGIEDLVYAYPVGSGLFAGKPGCFTVTDCTGPRKWIIFTTNAQHYHIVQSDNTYRELTPGLGGCIFNTKRLKISNITSFDCYEDIEKYSRDNFSWPKAAPNYFGIKANKGLYINGVCAYKFEYTYDDFLKHVHELNG